MAGLAEWLRTGVRSVRRGDGGDLALALALVGLSFVPGAMHQGVNLGELPGKPLDALGVLLLVGQGLPVLLRRRMPVVCLVLVCGAYVAAQLLGYVTVFSSIGLLVALYSAGEYLARWRRIVTAGAIAVYIGFSFGLHAVGSKETPTQFFTFFVLLAVCWIAGTWMRARAGGLLEQQRRAEAAAAAAERARIARELHDVVTHHVTAMVVQADAGQYLTGEPDRMATGMAAISETGRRALTDLRYLLGALDGKADAERKPAAGQLPDLVRQSRAAGQPVELVEHGEPRPMAGAAEVAVYRVVQEALTNALKHAAGERTVVTVHHGAEWLDLEVSTDKPSRPGIGRGSGRGLVGLRERVSVVGGDLTAGARPDGGFTVAARIPLGMS